MTFKITFQYHDEMSKGQWRTQSCQIVAASKDLALQKCKEWYGLGVDCEYKIVSIDLIKK